MPDSFNEGVRPGGLTTNTEIRILLCYLLDCIDAPITHDQIVDVLLGEELVNYFVLAEALSKLCSQGLISQSSEGYRITDTGRTVAQTLAQDVPRTIREAAVRGVIRAQQYAAKTAAHRCDIVNDGSGRIVRCTIGDEAGTLFKMELFMPDELSAQAVKEKFIESGDNVFKLVLSALTGNKEIAAKALEALE